MEPQACAGCGVDVIVDLRHGTAEDAGGRFKGLTYADADIVVWECPACEFTNADITA